jgi:glycosyltransferase involved in cell wall biosynthesis
MALANAILFYTDSEEEEFLSDGFPARHDRCVAALNNGIDIEPIGRRKQPYCARDRDKALLFIGRLTEKANLELGLEALALLEDEAPRLHVIGGRWDPRAATGPGPGSWVRSPDRVATRRCRSSGRAQNDHRPFGQSTCGGRQMQLTLRVAFWKNPK